jgi:hypothetical protein
MDVFGSWGQVSDVDSGHYGSLDPSEIRCSPVYVSPCSVSSLAAFLEAVDALRTAYLARELRWWYAVPFHDCTEFLEDGIIMAAVGNARRFCD